MWRADESGDVPPLPAGLEAAALLTELPIGLLIFDASGAIIWGNDAVADMLGEPVSALLGVTFDDPAWGSVRPDGTPMARHELPVARVLATGAPVVEQDHRVKLRSGEVRVLVLSAQPLPADATGEPRVLLTLRDDTRGVMQRESLDRLNTRFRMAQEASRIGLWEWDVEADSGSWDEASWRLLEYEGGAPDDHLTWELWRELVHPDDRDLLTTRVRRAMREGGPFELELRYQNAKGAWRWFHLRGRVMQRDAAGRALLIAGTQADIHRLRETERMLEEISENIEEVFWIRNRERVLYVNAAYERIFGRPPETLLADGASWLESVHPGDRPRVEAAFTGAFEKPRSVEADFRVLSAGEAVRWVHARSYPVEGSEERTIASVVDVTREMEARLALEEQARTDMLTGLWNRGHFESRLNEALAHWSRYGTPSVLLLLDLDDFKKVNDTHGHDIGDRVLVDFAERLRKGVRETDLVARWGGEEFVILLTHTRLDQGVHLAESLRERIGEDPFPEIGRMTTSLGVSTFLSGDRSVRELLRRADSAMYAAKAAGKNRVHVDEACFDAVMGQSATRPTGHPMLPEEP